MNVLATARFFTTVAQLRQLPPGDLPEVAFVGRSNAGKSTAINALCQRRRLAFASRTPGRTQALNYFEIGPSDAPVGYLVDMPGYGYAVAPQDVRQDWDQLGGRYLQQRHCLAGVVLIVDSRREITERDQALLRWVSIDVPVLAIASKCDKLNRAERQRACRQITHQIAEHRPRENFAVIAFSATDGIGIEPAREHIENWFATLEQEKKTPAKGEPGPNA